MVLTGLYNSVTIISTSSKHYLLLEAENNHRLNFYTLPQIILNFLSATSKAGIVRGSKLPTSRS